MNNVNELRKNLLKLFHEIKAGSIDVKHATEMNNTAGKIINSVKLELDYADLRKEKPHIPFVEYSKDAAEEVMKDEVGNAA